MKRLHLTLPMTAALLPDLADCNSNKCFPADLSWPYKAFICNFNLNAQAFKLF